MEKSVKKLNFLLFVITFAQGLLFFQKPAQAFQGELKSYYQKTWDFDFTSRYYMTNSNFSSSGGTYVTLPANYGYKSYDFDFSLRKVMSGTNWALFGDAQVSAAESDSTLATKTNSGVTQLMIGTDYIMSHGSYDFIPEFTFTYPLVQNDFNSSVVAINEGVMELCGKLIVQTNFGKRFLAGAFAGFDYRASGRSSLIPYGIQGQWIFRSWTLEGNLQGYSSASYDVDTANSSLRNSWFISADGGSLRYGAINPQLLETNIWARINTTKNLKLLLGYGMALNGASIANDVNVMAGFSYHIPAPDTIPAKVAPEDNFKEEVNDGVDQNLFAPPPPPPAPKVKSKPATPVINQENLQQELDKTEMQIELKPIKPNKRQDQ